MLDFATCEQLVSRARDKRSKPYANNTRIERRGEDTYALKYHATDVATFHRDGRIVLNTNGWRTVTTMLRLREVTPHVYSERGTWWVTCEPDSANPVALHPPSRTVVKPFHALDPGPEPVDDGVGCIAGTREEFEGGELKAVYDFSEQPPSWVHVSNRYYADGSGPARFQHIAYVTGIVYGEAAQNYHWDPSRVAVPAGWTYKQCPHCERFQARHGAWEAAMHGSGWGRTRTLGYAKMCEQLERYGSREAWQEAYIADFRKVREARKAWREARDAGRVLFEDGIEITAEGYAKRPDPKQIAREQRKLQRVERKRQKIRKFVNFAMDELKSGRVPMPGQGDCWGCLFRDRSDPGAEPMGVDHLEQHILDRYVVPSMLVNALREVGYRDEGIYVFLVMDPEHGKMGGERTHVDIVSRALYRYMTSRLIPTIGGSAPTGIAPRHYSAQAR